MKKIKKTKKITPWMSAYKFALGAIVVMTVVAIGAMVAQYWTFKANEWMYADPEIDMIEEGELKGIEMCGSTEETKGGCVNVALSTPMGGDMPCQEVNPAGAAAAGVTTEGCRAMAASLQSWAGAYRSDACQPGLLFDQKSISSPVWQNTGKPKGNVDLSGMHKCWPGRTGLKYKVVENGKTTWKTYVTYQKAACKYGTEAVVRIMSNNKAYKFCAKADVTLDGGTGCYTGAANKPSVKLCCPAGKTAVSGVCK